MASFSERMGLRHPKIVQLESMDGDLRNSLWNTCRPRFFDAYGPHVAEDEKLKFNAAAVWAIFLKRPVDEVPFRKKDLQKFIMEFFQEKPWNEIYDFIEFAYEWLAKASSKDFETVVNYVLEREKSAYRLVTGQIVPITQQHELDEIGLAAGHESLFENAASHIREAIALYSDRKDPNYRNSVKESISAVEAAALQIVGNNKDTLGQAIKRIAEKHGMHPAFKEAILKLYGYTSDASGIRHCLTEASLNIDEADARYMLVSCSAFVNFLASRYAGSR